MAHIPDIATSTRRIETMPSRNFAPSVWGEATRDIASAGHALAGLAHRARMAQEANDRREAEYNIALADNFYRNAAIGHEVVDPQTGEKKFVPGRLSLTRKQMDAEGTDSVKITRSIVDDMHSQDWYRSMKPSVRKLFDRKFALRRDAWLRAAGENDIRANLADHVEKTKEYMALNAQGVASVYGADTPTFENTATNAAFRNMMFLEESAIENEDEFDSVPVTAANLKEAFSKIRWNAGVTDEYKNRVYNRMLKGVHEFEVNRISALTMAGAKGESLGALSPEECLSTAEGMIDALREKTLSDVNPVTGKPTELMTEDQSAALLAEIGTAKRKLEGLRTEATKVDFAKCQNALGELELNLLDPKKVAAAGNSLNYEAYCEDLAKNHHGLTEAQSVALRKEYRALCSYYDKYENDLAKYQAAQAREKEQYGFFEGGIFHPASAFPENSDTSSLDEFNTASSVWQDPKSAMAKLEAARMTGRLSRADYIAYKKHGQMLMNDEAKTWWYKMYGKFDIPGLTGAEYGEENVSRDIRKLRGKKNYTAASGIYAANKGTSAKLYHSAADFVADTLEHDGYKERSGWENESLVPIETLPKVYDTVLRLAKAGVDPADAVRAILQPAIEEGLRRDLNERLSDPDYFTTIVSNFRAHGTHFFGDSTKQTADGGANWYADRAQSVTANLARQGRVKPKDEKDTSK